MYRGPLRFKRCQSSGGNLNVGLQPWWHIARQRYDPNKAYGRIDALCGYATSNARRAVEWTMSIEPQDADRCENCERLRKEQKNA